MDSDEYIGLICWMAECLLLLLMISLENCLYPLIKKDDQQRMFPHSPSCTCTSQRATE